MWQVRVRDTPAAADMLTRSNKIIRSCSRQRLASLRDCCCCKVNHEPLGGAERYWAATLHAMWWQDRAGASTILCHNRGCSNCMHCCCLSGAPAKSVAKYAAAAKAIGSMQRLRELHFDAASGEFRDYGLHSEDVQMVWRDVPVPEGSPLKVSSRCNRQLPWYQTCFLQCSRQKHSK